MKKTFIACSLLAPNSTEAGQLTNTNVTDLASTQVAAQILHGKGVRQLIITLGIQGSLFASAYASVCVERAGAANFMPRYEDAVTRMQQYPELAISEIGVSVAATP